MLSKNGKLMANLEALTKGLSNISFLNELDVSSCNLTAVGITSILRFAIGEKKKERLNLRFLNLSKNIHSRASDSEVNALIKELELLKSKPHLKIDLSDNKWRLEDKERISKAWIANNSSRTVDCGQPTSTIHFLLTKT
jgi:Ran GTPase-activating protein (RanGAP) involved in mRNA processing and transport